jgi:hypothetical protein
MAENSVVRYGNYEYSLPISPLTIEERIRAAYFVHMGDPRLISEQLHLPLVEVQRHVKAITDERDKDPQRVTADSITMYIIAGSEMRKYHLNKQLTALNGRDQMWRSVCCHKPIEVVPATKDSVEFTICLDCGRRCSAEVMDQVLIFRLRNETIKNLREEDESLLKNLEKLNIIGVPQGPPAQNIQQNIVVVGGKAQDYMKLGPMEMDRLLKDLREDIITLDATIQTNEEKIKKEEVDLARAEEDLRRAEEGTGGQEEGAGSGEENNPRPEEKT